MRKISAAIGKTTLAVVAAGFVALSLAGCGAAETEDNAAGNAEQAAAESTGQDTAAAENTASAEQTDADRGMLVGETYADVCGQDGVEDCIRIWLTHLNEDSELPEHGYNVDVVNYLTAYPDEAVFLEILPGTAADGSEEITYAEQPVYERRVSTDYENQITVGLISRDGQDYLIEYRYYLKDQKGSYGYEMFWLDADKQDSDSRVVAEECLYTYDLAALEDVTLQSLTDLSVFADYLSAEELERVTAALDEVLPEVTVLARGSDNPAECAVLCGAETRAAGEFLGHTLGTTIEAEYVAKELVNWIGTQLAENPNLWAAAWEGVTYQPDDAWVMNFTVWEDLLGYDHVLCVHTEYSYQSDYAFYVEESGILHEIASAWGVGLTDDGIYPVDRDGDGSAELLICDVTYYADGGKDLILYRTAEDGTAQEASGIDLLDEEYQYDGIGSLWAEYLPEDRAIRVHYCGKAGYYVYKDYPLPEHYDRLVWYDYTSIG